MCLERGRKFERGLRPLFFNIPSPARKSLAIYCATGWRGVGGEAKLSPDAN
jgi:hypothetical protein